MDVEKTIEFLLKNQARADARFNAKFDRADERFRKLERVVAQNNRIVTRLARYGVSLRSDVRRLAQETHAEIERLTRAQAATDRQLKTLIQATMHRNGGR
jgi:hypothetical protein